MKDPERLLERGSAFERELLDEGRRDEIPRSSAVRISAALGVAAPMAAGGLAAAAAGAGAGSAGGATGGKFVLLKTALALTGAGVIGAATTIIAGSQWRTAAPPPAPTALSVPAPVQRAVPSPPVTPVVVSPAPLEAQVEEPEAPAPQPRRVAKAPSPPTDTLALELKAIDGARGALASGNATHALSLLDEYERRFSKRHLSTEATVLRIEALTRTGQRDRALRLGNAFLARSPKGPYARRVRSLVGDRAAPATP